MVAGIFFEGNFVLRLDFVTAQMNHFCQHVFTFSKNNRSWSDKGFSGLVVWL